MCNFIQSPCSRIFGTGMRPKVTFTDGNGYNLEPFCFCYLKCNVFYYVCYVWIN